MREYLLEWQLVDARNTKQLQQRVDALIQAINASDVVSARPGDGGTRVRACAVVTPDGATSVWRGDPATHLPEEVFHLVLALAGGRAACELELSPHSAPVEPWAAYPAAVARRLAANFGKAEVAAALLRLRKDARFGPKEACIRKRAANSSADGAAVCRQVRL